MGDTALVAAKLLSELFPPQLAQSMVDDDMRVLREGAPVTVVECFNDRIYTTTKFPIKRKGKPLLIAGFTIDITERNRNEELRRQVETIIQHDLRTPAGFAVSLASALRGDINLTDQQRYLLERMEHAGLEMLDTLSRSLTLFKIETSQYQCVLKSLDCLPLVKELARNMSLRPQFESIGLEIVMDGQPLPSDAVYPCICEAELLRPALNNILENALQASPPGSGVRVNLASGQDCCIEIRNNGTVPMEIRDRFFDKYVTHGKFKGTGIGTYSAKMMIEAQGGSIEMRTSDEKNETTVTIFIPAQTR